MAYRGAKGVSMEELPKFVTLGAYLGPNNFIDPKHTNKTTKTQVSTYLSVRRQVRANAGLPLTVLLPVKKGITTVTINFPEAPCANPQLSRPCHYQFSERALALKSIKRLLKKFSLRAGA